ncbi:class I adenylate-forming enzyme family protein [Phytohabitans sp. LJ34]|uniref:class I adenylate-forming enzyme family protein n=1 Tax=Phytohabitans sp. LJ34 TaxID=3452217 RepID=UPI003F8B42BA
MRNEEVAALFPPGTGPVPGSAHERFVAERLAELAAGALGGHGDETIAQRVRRHATAIPDRAAFVAGSRRITWREYDELSDRLAAALLERGLRRGDRVGVLLPDGVAVHAVYVAAQKAGVVVVGIGPRAARQEIRHLLTVSGATALVSHATHRDTPVAELVDGLPLAVRVELDGATLPPLAEARRALASARPLGVAEVHLLNGTSGTTGMPKCVAHNQARWIYFHELAVEAGAFTPDDVFLSLIPAPYGFAQWTASFTPTLLGCPTVVMPRFDAAGALELIERERATVVCCVSTQFIMMLNSADAGRYDLSSLRCMFTGGEAVPYARAAEFERRTGARVLQFYGSNETGAVSRTTVDDTVERRLGTAGRVVDGLMRVRLLAEDGTDVTAAGGPGQAACAGPTTCLGYFGDPAANEELITPDGWMLTGDVCTIDGDGYLRVVGRTGDFIIRGGKNISAAAVEDQVGTHPGVAMVAAVAVPDATYGERVCAVIVPRPGATVDLEGLREHLRARGVSPENWPERVELVAELPRASGGKVAKAELRRRLAA